LEVTLQDHGCVATHLAAFGAVTFHRPIGMEVSATTTAAAAVMMTAARLTTAASLTLH